MWMLAEAPSTGMAYEELIVPAAPARRRAWQETTVVRVRVVCDGSVRAVQLHRTSGYESLDHEALRAAKLWRFEPGCRNGEPIEQWHVQPVDFRLR